MKPDIAYVYDKLKQLRFDFKESDYKLFPNEYTFDYGLDRYVRVDGNDLYISKDTFKPLEEELEYADRCHNFEDQLGCPLEIFVNINLGKIKFVYDKNGNRFYINEVSQYYQGFHAYRHFEPIQNLEYDDLVGKWNGYKVTWWLKENREE